METAGIEFLEKSEPERIGRGDNGLLKVTSLNGTEHTGYDLLLWAVGRVPASAGLGLEMVQLRLNMDGEDRVLRMFNPAGRGVTRVP